MDIVYKCDKTDNFSDDDIHDFLKLLRRQGQVEGASFEKIRSCPFICIVYCSSLPIGIGAIKQIYSSPFKKAGLNDLKLNYKFELGYIFLVDDKEYRGTGIGKRICLNLLNKVKEENIFATTEENEKNSMKYILQKFNFVKSGDTYLGGKTKKDIGLYLLKKNV